MIPIGRGQRELIIGDRQDRQDRRRHRHHHQPEAVLGNRTADRVHLRGRRAEGIHRRGRRRDARRSTARWTTPSWSVARLVRAGPDAVHRPLLWARRHGRVLHVDQGKGGDGQKTACPPKHALCVYDDLSKHAVAYRQILAPPAPSPGARGLPRRRFLPPLPPARAGLPSSPTRTVAAPSPPSHHRDPGGRRFGLHPDQRHLHHRRADLPRESNLFYSGVRPAVNVGLSVSRVGRFAPRSRP
jgi:F-type H+-transporting ATPase subunit alpha